MIFRVLPNQQIPHFRHEPPNKPERIMLVEGDEIEGPEWWTREFSGRMVPLDDEGQPVIDPRMLRALAGGLATARAHEKVTLLEQAIAESPALADVLQPKLDEARAKAEEAQAAFQERQAARQTPAQARAEQHAGVKVQDAPAPARGPAAQAQAAAPKAGAVKTANAGPVTTEGA